MAATLATQYTAATTSTFQQRVSIALINNAVTVKGESATGRTVQENNRRQNLANLVLKFPGPKATGTDYTPSDLTLSVAYALAGATFDDTSTDTAISNAIATNWSKIAGFSLSEV